jgi:hypothetical protein
VFEHNPVTRYVFNLDDIHAIAVGLDSAAGDLVSAAGSMRAAAPALRGLPGLADDAAGIAAAVAHRLSTVEHGLRTDARWLAGVLAALAADDAGAWTARSVKRALHFAHTERRLRAQLAATGREDWRGRRAGRAAALAVDLFGADVTGTQLPRTALSYYRAANRIRGIDRRLWQLRYPVAYYGAAAAGAVASARAHATGALRRLLDGRERALAERFERARAGLRGARDGTLAWARRVAGEGRGFGRLRRVGESMLPLASLPGLYVDARELMTQRHGYGPRGALEVFRDTNATVASALHVGSDAFEVVPGVGTVADKGVDAVADVIDLDVMALDGMDFVVFDKGDDIVHAARGVAGGVAHAVGSIL